MVFFPRKTKQPILANIIHSVQTIDEHRQASEENILGSNPNCGRYTLARRSAFATKGISSILGGLFLAFAVATSSFAQSCLPYPSPHQRIGFNVAPDNNVDIDDYDTVQLGAGWYHNYKSMQNPAYPGGIEYHQMVRSSINRTRLESLLGPKIAANPGAVWLIGNEPDSGGQDNLTPAGYATFYHDIYTFIKAADPTSRVAVGGVSQPTSIRLRYLDMVLSSYKAKYGVSIPFDLWHVHNFILPEDCTWGGVSIPPGLEAYRSEGIPCHPTFNEHGDINTFKEQLRTFRSWMKDHGFQNAPLIVSEYGILLSKYHGYDHARVRDYMVASFDFMLNTTDPATGYPADDYRLVQELAWFSLNFFEFDINTYEGLNGNLLDHDSGALMPLGADFAAYTQAKTLRTIDLAVRDFVPSSSTVDINDSVTFTTTFVNQGAIAAEDVKVQLWMGAPDNGGQLLSETLVAEQLRVNCEEPIRIQQEWQADVAGLHTVYSVLTASNLSLEVDDDNNYVAIPLMIQGFTPTPTPTPTATTSPTGSTTPTPLASPTATPTATATSTPTATPTSTTTPVPTVAPLPVASTTIDPARTSKLTVMSADGIQVQITIPAGTISEPITMVLRLLDTLPSATRSLSYAGRSFQLEAYRNGQPVTDLQFTSPIQLVIGYLESDLALLQENSLALYTFHATSGEWTSSGVTLIQHNRETNRLTVSYSDGSGAAGATRSYALFAGPATTPTPTATPTATPTVTSTVIPQITPSSTPTPVITGKDNTIYLPLIQDN